MKYTDKVLEMDDKWGKRWANNIVNIPMIRVPGQNDVFHITPDNSLQARSVNSRLTRTLHAQ